MSKNRVIKRCGLIGQLPVSLLEMPLMEILDLSDNYIYPLDGAVCIS